MIHTTMKHVSSVTLVIIHQILQAHHRWLKQRIVPFISKSQYKLIQKDENWQLG